LGSGFAGGGAPFSLQSVQRSGDYRPANAIAAALAWAIAARRAPIARRIYAQLGGASPLLANTEMQAEALEAHLGAPIAVLSRCAIGIH